MEDRRLAPFPDELVNRRDVDEAISWLNGTGVPSRFKASALVRWGAVTGVAITREHLARVGRLPFFPRG